MLTPHPCIPSSPHSPSDRACLRVPVTSNFGVSELTLILRHDGRLGSSAGEVASWQRVGNVIRCELEKSYDWQPDAVFVVKETHALVRLLNASANQ